MKDLSSYETNEKMATDIMTFGKCHARIQEIQPKLKECVAHLDPERRKKFDTKAEKKVQRATL